MLLISRSMASTTSSMVLAAGPMHPSQLTMLVTNKIAYMTEIFGRNRCAVVILGIHRQAGLRNAWCLKVVSGCPRVGQRREASAPADSQHGHCLRWRHLVMRRKCHDRRCRGKKVMLGCCMANTVYICHIALLGLQH